MRILRSLTVAVVLLLAVYLPSFGAASLLAPDIRAAVPVVIAVSFALACSYLVVASYRNQKGAAAYGIATAPPRYMFWGLAMGIAFGFFTRLLFASLDVSAPIELDDFSRWQTILLFWIAAPVQEEVIFRGLIQGSLESRTETVVHIGTTGISLGAIVAAALFALVHLPMGLAVASGAMLLGLVAGQLRYVSGSLSPAILVHALFNIACA